METLITKADAEAGEYEAALDQLVVGLEQDDREVSPRLTFYRADGVGFDMTADEARELADHITALLGEAQQ
jgi:hypothetical protein